MNYFKEAQVRQIVRQALREDIGRGDLTTRLTIPKYKRIKAVIAANEKGILCGIKLARLVFQSIDRDIRFIPIVSDGDRIKKGDILARIYGFACKILSAERVALNFLGLLSGVSSRTRLFVDRVKPYKVKILDTRKTLPGLRILEKYAVRIGGGYNHRFRLDEMVLVKDNHFTATRSPCDSAQGKQGHKTTGLKDLIVKIKKKIPKQMKIEIEVKDLSQFKQALEVKPGIIMLDNMKIGEIKKAVKIRNSIASNKYNPIPKLEVSGNITLDNVKQYAGCGMEFISIGGLTKDIDSLDISLDIL